MLTLIIVIITIVILYKVIDSKVIIRFDTLFRKGFAIAKDKYGVYCFTR